jgi:hypothetical protein
VPYRKSPMGGSWDFRSIFPGNTSASSIESGRFCGTDKTMTQAQQTKQSVTQANLSGEWIGFYRGHFDQVIKITQDGDEVVAVKITGDDHVPGGCVTFRANVKTGVGEGQVAEKEYRNPCFVPGKLEVVNPERIVFTWENCGKVEFRKDD